MNDTFEIIVPEKPVKIKNLVCEEIEEMGSYVYINEQDGTTITLNATASAVFDMCDGQHRAEDMAQTFAETLGANYDDALRDVRDILAELSGFGFFKV